VLERFDQYRDVDGFRTASLAGLAARVGCDTAWFVSLTPDRFFREAPPYLADFVQRPDLHAVMRRIYVAHWREGAYVDAVAFGGRERASLPLVRELLGPSGITSQAVMLVRFAGRVSGVVHFNRHGRSRPFAEDALAGIAPRLPELGALHAALLFAESGAPPVATPRFGLTAREAEVARLAALGRSTKEIGEVLGTSWYTVRNQLSVVFQKCRVRSRVELAALLAAGVTPPTDPPRARALDTSVREIMRA
jgi:DNA-binding CsgD family transcriptional regulator